MFKGIKKTLRRIYKRLTKRDFLVKFLIVISSLALIGTAILPYIGL